MKETAPRLELNDHQIELEKSYFTEKHQESEKGKQRMQARAQKKESMEKRIQKIIDKCGVNFTGDKEALKEALKDCRSRLKKKKPDSA